MSVFWSYVRRLCLFGGNRGISLYAFEGIVYDYLCGFREMLQVTVMTSGLVPLYNVSGEQVPV